MQLLSLFTSMALVSAVVAASPMTDFKKIVTRADRGSEVSPGIADRKKAILGAGGNTRDLAIAMLETNTMTSDYTYGDGKTGDGTNFGIFKQNWYMLRTSASEFLDESTEQVKDGAILNSDLGKDIKARHEGEEHYGYEIWFSGHRNGATGVQNPGTDDIKTYMNGVAWIQEQIESDPKYQTDDTRFWVNVTPI
ncbi:hypothetical protein N7491_007521 [Penicillium cf. griseofulvum]|uniref:Uncharacterized protein n=1 Tax=Penicillium cf. griseofulvum TaxID=2972120 RepID=A0A9W9IUR4_9EURO|nr:hypothetical protein N7472_009448 [Penicillium cf. griseofulvum]KAJ5430505.1 hypothetical protein N7491_007521 [Penicillium cf. griseofulvum]KAJ5435725.1 hypothetical protein N7445_006610 [Penicillium cf. griseofulvum]